MSLMRGARLMQVPQMYTAFSLHYVGRECPHGEASSNAHLQKKDEHENDDEPRLDVFLPDPRRYFA